MKFHHNHLFSECAYHDGQSLTEHCCDLTGCFATTESIHCVRLRQADRTSSVRTDYNQPWHSVVIMRSITGHLCQ